MNKTKGCLIANFATVPTRIPEGYILESPGEREDIVLSRADFHALEKLLEQKETWEQVVGVTCFGGATWQLRPTVQS
ncbi:cytoplasmic protein [Klebsiella pneumoniae]